MSKIAYQAKSFSPAVIEVIDRARAIAEAYAQQGYSLTLRQMYYQFVSRDWLPNTNQSYDKLGRIVSDARLAGLIDWDHLVDRTRKSDSVPHWDSPADIVEQVARQFRIDKWADQRYYVEAWVEKEALVDVISRPARRWDLRWFACRGYVSQSAQHEAAMRFVDAVREGKEPIILHLGDHDPSGIDMTRDIYDRINMFVDHHTGGEVEVRRLALNMDQVVQYAPPPNPAKATDARFAGYRDLYGDESWELDALDPPTIDALITAAVEPLLDDEAWSVKVEEERRSRELLAEVSRQWDDVAERIEEGLS